LISVPQNQLRDIGTLVQGDEQALTLDEYHPEGTHYWSLGAPIAPRYFPSNRCKVSQCTSCGRCFLRYTESGAYHIEERVRYLDPALIVDAPLLAKVQSANGLRARSALRALP
jgi:hypothetical protein